MQPSSQKLAEALALLPNFAQIPISRETALQTALEFEGIEYDERFIFVEFDADGKPRGKTNCYGLFFLWAQRLGLLGSDFFPRLNMAFSIAGAAPVLRFYMESQTVEVPLESRLPCDWLLFRWKNASPIVSSEDAAMLRCKHHVAMWCGNGEVFHAVDTSPDGAGQVYQAPLGPHDAGQIVQVRTLPQFFIGGSHG